MLRTLSWWLSGVAGVAILLEVLFRVLPVSTSTETGYYVDPLILTYPPHHGWTTSTGWDLRNAQALQSNNLGFLARRDFKRDERAVALIGDSFVEASMLAAADRPDAQLERALGSRPVYAMGSPGTSLLDYAERIRFVVERFAVRDVVLFIERGDVLQALCGSGNSGSCLDARNLEPRTDMVPPADALKRWLRHSALAQYLVSQLKINPQKLWQQMRAQSNTLPPQEARTSAAAAAPPLNTAAIDAVTSEFFRRVRPFVTGRLVLVLDSDRGAIYRGRASPNPGGERFSRLAREAGAVVIDLGPRYQAQLDSAPERFDVGPYDGHLNALGVKLMTQAAADGLHSAK